jgi:hypothetical protein
MTSHSKCLTIWVRVRVEEGRNIYFKVASTAGTGGEENQRGEYLNKVTVCKEVGVK